jgi:fatty acid desaturase
LNSIRSDLNALIVGLDRSRESTPAGLFLIFGTVFSAGCGAILAEALSYFFPNLNLIFRAAAVLWIGTRMRALGNMMHECSHGIFVQSPAANLSLGHLLAALDLSSFTEYSAQHNSHHAHLGDPDRDLDFRSRLFLLAKKKSFSSILNILLMSVLLVPLWLRILRPVFWARHAPVWSHFVRLGLLFASVLACIHSNSRSITLLYVVVPYLTAYQWMKLFSDACDHLFITGSTDPNDRSRNHLFRSTFLNKLLFPRNDGFHLVHHLFPTLPTRCYPETHLRLMKNPWYCARTHYLHVFKTKDRACTSKPAVQGQSR